MARWLFPHTRRPLDQQRVAVGHPAAGREVPHLLGIERRLGREVEGLQRALVGELGDGGAHLDASFLAVGHLRLAQQCQRLTQRQIPPRRLVQQPVEPIAHRRQLQAGKHIGERVYASAHQPPPASCSYSARDRSSAISGGATAIAGSASTGPGLSRSSDTTP